MSSTILLVIEALDRGVKARGIEPMGYEWPPERARKHKAEKSLQQRYQTKFDITFLMNEKEIAILNFLNPAGGFEYMGFTSTDENAVKWCKDIFEYYWETVV